jgi:hypothetical protein
VAREDAPDGGRRRDRGEAFLEVVADADGTGVEAGGVQLLTEGEDGRLDFEADLAGAGVRAPGAGR